MGREFSWIETYFAPLCTSYAVTRNLQDDAAFLNPPPGYDVVVTTDTICGGVHFIGNESPDKIAQKLLGCNLSDLAAKGATPWHYTLNTTLLPSCNEAWLKSFTQGLQTMQNRYGLSLIGGDTTVAPMLVLTATLFGLVPKGRGVYRKGAKPGDIVFMTGTLGDAFLGLKLLKEEKNLTQALTQEDEFLKERYQVPQPRVALGKHLYEFASAGVDISDGLLLDAQCLAKACDVRLTLEAAALPLSKALSSYLEKGFIKIEDIVAGGDDYEILFTASPQYVKPIQDLSYRLKTPIKAIGTVEKGQVEEGPGVIILDRAHRPMAFKRFGFEHNE